MTPKKKPEPGSGVEIFYRCLKAYYLPLSYDYGFESDYFSVAVD